jgi:N utilization substance protein A
VVEKVTDPRIEVTLAEAVKVHPGIQMGEPVLIEDTPHDAGRIAAQTAKQVILQRLHEAESTAIVDEYAGKAGDIVSGMIQRAEPRQVVIDLGRAEAVMPPNEQVHTERYRPGQRLKVYMVEVARTVKGAVVVVSRSHPGLLRRLFEMEIPEIYSGMVEITGVAREAGARSKVAVSARQSGIDPVGCCVGLRGIRIQNIVSELNGEKIDVISWSADPAVLITNALSPAQVVRVIINEGEKTATAVIPDRQQSLAIGKEGQNVRLAVKLTGWRIDIKSVSQYEAEHPVVVAPPVVEPEPVKEEKPAPKAKEKAAVKAEEKSAEKPAAKPQEKPAEPLPELAPEIMEPVLSVEPEAPAPEPEPVGLKLSLDMAERVSVGESKSGVRFAEDILGRAAENAEKKKRRGGRDSDDRDKRKKKRSGGAGEFDFGDDY